MLAVERKWSVEAVGKCSRAILELQALERWY